MNDDEQATAPEDTRQKRARAMVGLGAIALVWGAVIVVLGQSNPDGVPPAAFLLALVGALLLVGGLVLRR